MKSLGTFCYKKVILQRDGIALMSFERRPCKENLLLDLAKSMHQRHLDFNPRTKMNVLLRTLMHTK